MDHEDHEEKYEGRLLILILIIFILILGLMGRICYLGIIQHDFLIDQSNIRSVREVSIPAHRGIISDRNGEPLAISVPVASVWINPKQFRVTEKQINYLSFLLDMTVESINEKILMQKKKEFVYLKRSIPIKIANEINSINIAGLYLEKSYKRYYPEADATAHILGFTNIDDHGQEGLELAFDSWLRGVPGKIKVIKDRLGNTIATLGIITKPQKGRNLVLSIDRRIQYLAFNEIKNIVTKYHADSGSIVVLAVNTGEIIGMTNYPSYNPDNRSSGVIPIDYFRNRAITDVFEPGSTMKVFSVANALNSGKYFSNTIIDTNPGILKIENKLVYDDKHKNNGYLTVKEVLIKSSNIGVAKMTLSLPSNNLLNLLRSVGFGISTHSGFPGEATGFVPRTLYGRNFVLATLSFGYSISVTPLQLALAHLVIANGGIMKPVTFLKVTKQRIMGERIFPERLCMQIISMLEAATDTGGTGTQAQIAGYRVAGKTGTAKISSPHGGYYKDRYFSNFVGIAPVSNPQLVVVVVVKNPKGSYYGGQVAAPAFANVMNGALRLLNIPFDENNTN